MSLPIPVPATFRIIAHRGASAYAPENTLPAFRLAQEMGVYEVELDTQLTTDGQVVLCHDATLARYGHGPRRVEEMRWPELAGLDMGSWFSPFLFGGEPMVTLEQLFQVFEDRLFYHIELKGRAPGLPAAVHQLIRRHGLRHFCLVTSFARDSLAAMRSLDATLPMGWLVRAIDQEAMAGARELSLAQLCPAAEEVTPEAVAQARQVVSEVRAWGINGTRVSTQAEEVQSLIRRVLAAGCDGMTINWPDWVHHG